MLNNHYAVLGLNDSASTEEIKRVYKKLSQIHHPDKGGDADLFLRIKAAYDSLVGNENNSTAKKSAVMSCLADIFSQIIKNEIGNMPECVDLVSLARAKIEITTDDLRGRLVPLNYKLHELNSLVGRMQTKNDINLFDNVLANTIKELEQIISTIDNQLTRCEDMKILLEDYNFVTADTLNPYSIEHNYTTV